MCAFGNSLIFFLYNGIAGAKRKKKKKKKKKTTAAPSKLRQSESTTAGIAAGSIVASAGADADAAGAAAEVIGTVPPSTADLGRRVVVAGFGTYLPQLELV